MFSPCKLIGYSQSFRDQVWTLNCSSFKEATCQKSAVPHRHYNITEEELLCPPPPPPPLLQLRAHRWVRPLTTVHPQSGTRMTRWRERGSVRGSMRGAFHSSSSSSAGCHGDNYWSRNTPLLRRSFDSVLTDEKRHEVIKADGNVILQRVSCQRPLLRQVNWRFNGWRWLLAVTHLAQVTQHYAPLLLR